MNATPENFKPGERWLVWRYSYQTLREPPLEMTCIEWAQSGKFVKVMHGISKGVEWLKDRPFLGERLPDVESGNNQTGQASGVEVVGYKQWICDCTHCTRIKAEIEEAEKRGWAGKAADFFAALCGCADCKRKAESNANAEAKA